MISAKYMIGARCAAVSTIFDGTYKYEVYDVTKIRYFISAFYRKDGDADFTEVPYIFTWRFNDFQGVVEGLEPSTIYEMYVKVTYKDDSVDISDRIKFKTCEAGNITYEMMEPIVDKRGDFSDKIESIAQYVTPLMNDIGVIIDQPIKYRYDYKTTTARGNYQSKTMSMGYDFASKADDWGYIGRVAVHEMRHICGDAHYIRGSWRSIRFADGVDDNGTRLGNLPDYSVDNVYKFITGSDIAFLNLNGDHSSCFEGDTIMDMFMWKANNLQKVWIVSNQAEADEEIANV